MSSVRDDLQEIGILWRLGRHYDHRGGCVGVGSEGVNWRAGVGAMMVSVSQGLILCTRVLITPDILLTSAALQGSQAGVHVERSTSVVISLSSVNARFELSCGSSRSGTTWARKRLAPLGTNEVFFSVLKNFRHCEVQYWQQ